MASNNPGATAAPDPFLVPPVLATWLAVFRPCFTAPAWNRVLVLVAGAVLAPGKRTVTQALRVMGLAGGNHIPGGPRASWRRDAAPVVRPGDPAHHTGSAGDVLADHRLGRRPGAGQYNPVTAKRRGLVPQAGADFQ